MKDEQEVQEVQIHAIRQAAKALEVLAKLLDGRSDLPFDEERAIELGQMTGEIIHTIEAHMPEIWKLGAN